MSKLFGLLADSMRSQGREQEWERMEAQRKAAEQYLAERVADMERGDKRWFRDTFVLVRRSDHWMSAAMAEREPPTRAAQVRHFPAKNGDFEMKAH